MTKIRRSTGSKRASFTIFILSHCAAAGGHKL
jgi:hypothetical protein